MQSRRQLAVIFAAAAAVLVACNAIVGVEDVTFAKSDGGRRDTGGDDDDETPPNPDRLDGSLLPTDNGTLALGFNHSCARLPSGKVVCWGDNGGGELGDGVPFDAGDRPNVLKPQPVPGITDAVDIAAGISHTCIVHRPGGVSCWGINTFGQLGDGTTERSSSPVGVKSIDDAIGLGGGQSFTCALHKDKTVSCWGANYSGQLGDGTKVDRPTPVPVNGLAGVVSLTAAQDHACAVLENGEARCWGRNAEGQLGIGSTTESLTPTKLSALSDVAQVAAAARFACARQKSGKVYCWGSNDKGQLGNGIPNGAPNSSPTLVPSLNDAVFIWTGYDHACAVRKVGSVMCWGRADHGQTGTGLTTSDASVSVPTTVVGAATSIAVWTGGDRSCAMAQDGRAFCWGWNSLGQLGNGTTDPAYSAVEVSDFP